jgi:hypothetical protein
VIIVGDQIPRIRPVELVEFHAVPNRQRPAEHVDEYLVSVAGDASHHLPWQVACGTGNYLHAHSLKHIEEDFTLFPALA